MAQKGVLLDQDTISCSICLDILKDPVTIPCGHNYCINCIKCIWDVEDKKNIYSCPQCRQLFTPRPALVKNTLLGVLVGELKKAGFQAAPADDCYAGPGDVACDVCNGRQLKALKSCFVCLASYCEKHLQPHYDAAPVKQHKLVNPSKKLQENICSCHNEVMKMCCHTDRQSVCYLCSEDDHKDHDTVSAVAERQRKLEVRQKNIHQRIQDREKDVKLLQQKVEAINHSADKSQEGSEKIQKISSHVEQPIKSQQETAARRVREHQKKLEQEITELKKEDTKLKQRSCTKHHEFLHSYPSLSPLSGSTDSSRINIRSELEDVLAAVSEVREKPQKFPKISQTVMFDDVLPSQPEPKTRDGFLKYSCEIRLDPNTANIHLLLCEGNRKVKLMKQQRSYSRHPERFAGWFQALSRESLTGRCYWEVEWRGGGVDVAVAYKNISRVGTKCGFGHNNKSWALSCYQDNYTFLYNNIQTLVSGPHSSRVGVYLDHGAGVLSFYSVSETMTLLHRVKTTFTQPLYAGLWINGCYGFGTSAEFCKLTQTKVI